MCTRFQVAALALTGALSACVADVGGEATSAFEDTQAMRQPLAQGPALAGRTRSEPMVDPITDDAPKLLEVSVLEGSDGITRASSDRIRVRLKSYDHRASLVTGELTLTAGGESVSRSFETRLAGQGEQVLTFSLAALGLKVERLASSAAVHVYAELRDATAPGGDRRDARHAAPVFLHADPSGEIVLYDRAVKQTLFRAGDFRGHIALRDEGPYTVEDVVFIDDDAIDESMVRKGE